MAAASCSSAERPTDDQRGGGDKTPTEKGEFDEKELDRSAAKLAKLLSFMHGIFVVDWQWKLFCKRQSVARQEQSKLVLQAGM